MSLYGYAGKILKIDLTERKNIFLETENYAAKFIGGRGLAARLYWEMVSTETSAMDPRNCLIYAAGPVTGFSGLAGCRWTVCAKSPIHNPEAFSYGNLGGKFGSALKYAGYDALVVQGKADRPVYLFLHDGIVEIRDAGSIWGSSAFDTRDIILRELGNQVSLITIGPAAENRVVFATALSDGGASVSGGLGSVMGSKNLKAVAVTGENRPKAADPDRLRELVKLINRMKRGTYSGPSPWGIPGLSVKENCYGCGIGCHRHTYPGEDGRRYKLFCQATGVYSGPAKNYYGGKNDAQYAATRLCDAYGLDTGVMAPMVSWLIDCYKEGILKEESTGLPLSRAGSLEFFEKLARLVAYREGFGEVLAQGTLKAADLFGEKAREIAYRYVVTWTNENRGYDPRLISTTALLYATEPRMPIQQLHAVSGNTLIAWVNWARGVPGAFLSTDDLRKIAEKFWGSILAADFSTYEGKALAAKMAQDRVYAQESLILCDVHWPAMMTSAESQVHVGDPALESRVYSAITGNEVDEYALLKMGERIFNLQRALLLRQGWKGRNGDRILDYYFTEPLKKGEIFFNAEGIMPGRSGEIISKIGTVVDLEEFEKMKTDYYRLRGWDESSGIPTYAKLKELGLEDIAADLKFRNLLG